MRRLIYLAIKKRLLDTLPWLEYVDYYFQQYTEFEGQGAIVRRTPCVFVEFAPIDWNQQGLNTQKGIQYIMIHLVNESGYDNEDRVLDTQAVNHFERESEVYAALAGFRPKLGYLPEYAALANTAEDKQIMESLQRYNTNSDHELSRFMVSVQTFAATVFDYAALKDYSNQSEVLELNDQVERTNTIQEPYTR